MDIPETDGAAGPLSPRSVGIVWALAGTALYSLKPILVKIAYANGLGPEAVIGLRMLISLPVYLIVGILALRHIGWRASPQMIAGAAATGMLGYYAAAYLDLWALTYITAQLERIVLFTYPTWVIIFASMFLGEALTARKLIALGLTYLGVVAVVGQDIATAGEGVFTGVALAFATTLAFSGYMLASKRHITALGTGLFTSIAMVSASFMIAAHLGVAGAYGELFVSGEMLALIGVLALGATVAPSYLISAAVGRIGAGSTSIVSSVGPALTSFFAVMLLGEAFTFYNVIGLLLTGTGVVVLTWTGRPLRARISHQ